MLFGVIVTHERMVVASTMKLRYSILHNSLLLMLFLLLGLAVGEPTAASVVDGRSTSTTKPYDDEPPDCTHPDKNRLECWLWNLQVKIPSQSFKDWITITVHDMVCSQFQLQTLESSTNQNTLTLTIGTVHAFCHGRYHSSGGIKGDVQAGVSEQQQQQQQQEDANMSDLEKNGDSPHTCKSNSVALRYAAYSALRNLG